MKKFILIILIAMGAAKLHAQQLYLQPGDTSAFKTPKISPNPKSVDSELFKKYFNTPQLNALSKLNDLNSNTEITYSRMPVVKVGGNIDKMPVISLGTDTNMRYTMLVKKVKVVDPLEKSAIINP